MTARSWLFLALGALALAPGCVEPSNGSRARALTAADAGSTCGPITYLGCCSDQTLLYCAAGAVQSKPCAPGECGWNAVFGLYACGQSATSDPSGAAPRECPVEAGVPDATAADAVAPPDASSCGPLGYVGCCSGQTLHFCVSGQVLSLDCAQQPQCGWNPQSGVYDCSTSGTSDPSGQHPMACGDVLGDAGVYLDGPAPGDLAPDGPMTDALVDGPVEGPPDAQPLLDGAGPKDGGGDGGEDGEVSEAAVGLDASGLDVSHTDGTQIKAGGGGGCDGCQVGAGTAGPRWLAFVGLLLLPLAGRGQRASRSRRGRGSLVIGLLALALLGGCQAEQMTIGRVHLAQGGDGTTDLPAPPDLSAGEAGPAGCGKVPPQGCCDGDLLFYCEEGALKQIDCGDKPKCGWSASGFYDCNTSGVPDPSGTYGMYCSGLLPDGAPGLDGGPDASDPCEGITIEGCCDGTVLRFCELGELRVISCKLNPYCGWHPQGQYYDCGTEGLVDPSGTFDKVCPGSTPSDGESDLGSLEEASVDQGTDGPGVGDGCSCSVAGGDRCGPVLPVAWALLLGWFFRAARRRGPSTGIR